MQKLRFQDWYYKRTGASYERREGLTWCLCVLVVNCKGVDIGFPQLDRVLI